MSLLSFWLMSPLDRWQAVQYVASAIVIVGALGGYLAEFHILRDNEEQRRTVAKLSTLVILAGLAIELLGLVRTSQLSEITIARLNDEAGSARREAGRANERAGKAIERAARADERASENEKEAAALRKTAEDERLARIRIEERVAWRRLTKQQQIEIGSRLRRFSGQIASMWYNMGDKEAETLALEIASALYGAKWTVYAPASLGHMARSGILFNGSTSGLETGVTINGPLNEVGRNASDALLHELATLGFDVTKLPDSRRSDSPVVEIIVFVRPEGPQGEAKLRHQHKVSRNQPLVK